MVLSRKAEPAIIPQYSLTGDLISFLRCGLQYRYLNGSELPPSRPVQLWFGEFVHGVLESAYRIWITSAPAFPWPSNPTPSPSSQAAPPANRAAYDIGTIGDTVEATLRAQGKNPRSYVVRDNAYVRASRAVNELGPHLFPLIHAAEERVIGTRHVPPAPPGQPQRASLYELHGIIDVLTNVQLGSASTGNVIRQAIEQACPGLSGHFEVIVDYKGTRRPPTVHSHWQQGEWQVQTYAWLRTRQPHALPVAAGVLLYVNELAPVRGDLVALKSSMSNGHADVVPAAGSQDAYQLSTWRPGNAIPSFSLAYRLARTIRVIPINNASQTQAVASFDGVVGAIEQCVNAEAVGGSILQNWTPCGDAETCNACDFRHFCPSPDPHAANYVVGAPDAP